MDERVKFVARLLDGETMSALCREFGISRKTGYKLYARYRLEITSSRRYRFAPNPLLLSTRQSFIQMAAEKGQGQTKSSTAWRQLAPETLPAEPNSTGPYAASRAMPSAATS